jgi:hypothetical protein
MRYCAAISSRSTMSEPVFRGLTWRRRRGQSCLVKPMATGSQSGRRLRRYFLVLPIRHKYNVW